MRGDCNIERKQSTETSNTVNINVEISGGGMKLTILINEKRL